MPVLRSKGGGEGRGGEEGGEGGGGGGVKRSLASRSKVLVTSW